jgi:uncharacterized membrane protein
MSKQRLESLSDAVFAIAITLLVIDLKLPDNDHQQLLRQLIQHIPNMAAYVLSFIIIGLYWVAHHTMFQFIMHVNRTVIWLNLLVLMAVSFIPFPASVLGAHVADPTAIIFYAGSLAMVNIMSTCLWIGSTRTASIEPSFRRFVVITHGSPVIVYGIAAAVANLYLWLAWALIAAVPLFFILPNSLINRRLQNAKDHHDQTSSG